MRLDDIVRQIKTLHAQHSVTIDLGLSVARELGGLLIEAKEEVCAAGPRSGWCQWVKENLPFERHTAALYMRIYRDWNRVAEAAATGQKLNKTRASEIVGARKPRGDRTGETARYDYVKAAQFASDGDLVEMLVRILLERDGCQMILEKVQERLSTVQRRRKLAV